MRFYQNLEEARSEITRDLKEMGIPVRTTSYQNRPVKDEGLATIEIQDYAYKIQDADSIMHKPDDREWAIHEWLERLDKRAVNPGGAWKLRREYWEQFLNEDDRFDYTYGERIGYQMNYVIELLAKDPLSRRAIVQIWHPMKDVCENLRVRVPCSMYYHFMFRSGVLNVTYHQRSCDFLEHWQNDLYFARNMANYIGLGLIQKKASREIFKAHEVTVTHFVGSLHAYNKDLEGVF